MVVALIASRMRLKLESTCPLSDKGHLVFAEQRGAFLNGLRSWLFFLFFCWSPLSALASLPWTPMYSKAWNVGAGRVGGSWVGLAPPSSSFFFFFFFFFFLGCCFVLCVCLAHYLISALEMRGCCLWSTCSFDPPPFFPSPPCLLPPTNGDLPLFAPASSLF